MYLNKSPRLFVALPLSGRAMAALRALNDEFPGLKFAANLHLTLSFIGDKLSVDVCAAALRDIRSAAFDLRIVRLGMFGKSVFWAAPEPEPALVRLKAAIDAALAAVGFAPEERPYRPHITLCRPRNGLPSAYRRRLSAIALDIGFRADSFCLYNSLLAPGGALHELIETYGLD